MDGVGFAGPTPSWDNKLEMKKRTRSAAEAPGPESWLFRANPNTLQLFLLAEARGQGPHLVSACQQKGGCPSRSARSRKAAGALAEAAAVFAKPEDELSKFRELWQGPAERREESPELLALSRPRWRGGGLGLGPPGAEPAAEPEELELLRFLELFECSVLACGRRRRAQALSEELRLDQEKRAIVPSKGD